MDIGSVGHSGHHLHMAAVTPEVFLHQAKVDIRKELEVGKHILVCRVTKCKSRGSWKEGLNSLNEFR